MASSYDPVIYVIVADAQARTSRKNPPIKLNLPYCCSYNLILLKLLEIGCTLASLILALSFDGHGAIICIEILSALALVTTMSWCILYCLNMNARFPEFFAKLMFIYHLVMTLVMVAVVACAAFLWPQFKTSLFPQYLICTFTSLAAAILFLIDTIHGFLWSRGTMQEIVVFPCSPWEPELTL